MVEASSEQIKDLFAEFGVTYFHSEALCKGLGIYYALMSFKDSSDVTKPRIEELLVRVASLTLGMIIDKVKPLVTVDLQQKLDQALTRRNYLAHQFWYERAFDMYFEAGANKLIYELEQDRQLFEELDREIMELASQRLLDLGVTGGMLEEQMQRGLAGEPDQPLPTKSPLSKEHIRLVQAYNVPRDDGNFALVFLSDDNQFFQFCDVGLGWSNFTEVSSNWIVNELLEEYLPANFVPRPSIIAPWNFEFKLPKNSTLWVKKGKSDKTFRWGIRKPKKQLMKS